MAKSSKIKNKMFVWGNNSLNSGSDLTEVTVTQGFVTGVQGGELVQADELNSGLRNGSLVGYSLIEALSLGPIGAQSGDPSWDGDMKDYNNTWDANLATKTFDYAMYNSDLSQYYTDLRDVINQYLKYATVRQSVKANYWTNKRGFQIIDGNGHSGGVTQIDGSTDNATNNIYQIKLPSTINLKNEGKAYNVYGQINGTSIDEIISSDGETVLKSKQIETTKKENTSGPYYLTFVDSNNNSATPESIYTSSKININPMLGNLNLSGSLTSANVKHNWERVKLLICSTAATNAKKSILITDQFLNEEGSHIYVEFRNGNTSTDPLQLEIAEHLGNTYTYDIIINNNSIATGIYNSWNAEDILEMILVWDGNKYVWHVIGRFHDENIPHATNADLATNSTNAYNIELNKNGSFNEYLVPFTSLGSDASAQQIMGSLNYDSGLRYNPHDNRLYATYFSGLASRASADTDGNIISNTYAKKKKYNIIFGSAGGGFNIESQHNYSLNNKPGESVKWAFTDFDFLICCYEIDATGDGVDRETCISWVPTDYAIGYSAYINISGERYAGSTYGPFLLQFQILSANSFHINRLVPDNPRIITKLTIYGLKLY